MYYYISGKIAYLSQSKAVIDAGGIGYEITISDTTLSLLRRDSSEEALLYTYFNVREDAQELFGFYTLEEKKMFEQLISVSGVGPKAAMSILSAVPVEKLIFAIVSDDAKQIASAQGVGLRTAQKIILEIKDKLKKEDLSHLSQSAAIPEISSNSETFSEALEALLALGYSRAEAAKALKTNAGENMSVEELIRNGLKNLTK